MKFKTGYTIIKNNQNLLVNIILALLIKGLGLIVNLLSMPLYIRYFDNNIVLGVWFTLLAVLSWVLSFDVGIGNGLRNHLTIALANNDRIKCKKLISSGYFILGILTISVVVCFLIASHFCDYNSFFNISENIVDAKTLSDSITIIFSGILLSFFLKNVSSVLYALQLASVNNLIHFITSVCLVLFLCFDFAGIHLSQKLICISYVYAVVINLPLIIATIWVFMFSKLKFAFPTLKQIDLESSKEVVSLGLIFFVVQVLYMIITVTNEWFISSFFSPEHCVTYQAYYRVFSLLGSFFLLSLTPIWSAITKAYSEKRYNWIIKLQKSLYVIAILFSILQICIIPFLQNFFDVWLGENQISVDYKTAFIFLFYGSLSIWITVESTLVAGLGILKTQLIGYMFAVIFKVLCIIIYSTYINDWTIVVLATSIGLLPYCLYQPFEIKKILSNLKC